MTVNNSLNQNPTLAGTGGVTLPSGTTAQRGSTAGMMRLNTQTSLFESTVDGSTWATIETSAVGVTSITGTSNQVIASSPTGAVTLSLPQSINSGASPTFSLTNCSAYPFVAPTVQQFTSGSGTYTKPAGVLYINVKMVGGGGGGGGGGSASYGTGGTGGNSTFGTTLLVANGGAGGAPVQGGAGGTASLGSGPIGTALQGGSGSGSGVQNASSSGQCGGGFGASTPFGGAGGGSGALGNVPYNAITNSGSGGGGAGVANGGNQVGGGGGGAGGYVDAIITSPSSTYSYAIGSAGSAGTAGTGGNAGGAGGSGYIIVREYYQ